jgi:hypothetical protein
MKTGGKEKKRKLFFEGLAAKAELFVSYVADQLKMV